MPLPLPLLLLLLLRKWGFAASLFSVFVVDGLGFVQLCMEGLKKSASSSWHADQLPGLGL